MASCAHHRHLVGGLVGALGAGHQQAVGEALLVEGDAGRDAVGQRDAGVAGGVHLGAEHDGHVGVPHVGGLAEEGLLGEREEQAAGEESRRRDEKGERRRPAWAAHRRPRRDRPREKQQHGRQHERERHAEPRPDQPGPPHVVEREPVPEGDDGERGEHPGGEHTPPARGRRPQRPPHQQHTGDAEKRGRHAGRERPQVEPPDVLVEAGRAQLPDQVDQGEEAEEQGDAASGRVQHEPGHASGHRARRGRGGTEPLDPRDAVVRRGRRGGRGGWERGVEHGHAGPPGSGAVRVAPSAHGPASRPARRRSPSILVPSAPGGTTGA